MTSAVSAVLATPKWIVLVCMALVGLGVAYYSYRIASFDTETLPNNYGRVRTLLYASDREDQPLIVGLGGSEGGNAWVRNHLKPARDRFLEQGYALLAVAYQSLPRYQSRRRRRAGSCSRSGTYDCDEYAFVRLRRRAIAIRPCAVERRALPIDAQPQRGIRKNARGPGGRRKGRDRSREHQRAHIAVVRHQGRILAIGGDVGIDRCALESERLSFFGRARSRRRRSRVATATAGRRGTVLG